MEKFLLLNRKFVLRNTTKESILQNIENGSMYELTKEQANLIHLLDGTKKMSEIKKIYDQKSRKIVNFFIENLIEINAIDYINQAEPRFIQKNKVHSRRLESVHLEATGKCNMRCVDCYQGKLVENSERLEYSKLISLLDEIEEMQVGDIGISGGEPLMMEYLFPLLREIEKRNIRISGIFTNGLLINENFIREIKLLTSKFTIFVSLDSIEGKSMLFRGFSGNEASAVISQITRNIFLLIENGFDVTINTMVNKENISFLNEMYSLIETMKIKSWRLGFPKQTQLFKKHIDDFEAEWKLISETCLLILKRHLQNKKPFDLQIEYLYREKLLEQGLPNLKKEDYVCDYEGRRDQCCIKPNGDVVSCAFLNDMPIGNIKKQKLKDIWYSQKMRKVKNTKIKSVKECQGCELLSICGAGCRANAFFLHNDFDNAKDDFACKAMKFFKEEVYPFLIT